MLCIWWYASLVVIGLWSLFFFVSDKLGSWGRKRGNSHANALCLSLLPAGPTAVDLSVPPPYDRRACLGGLERHCVEMRLAIWGWLFLIVVYLYSIKVWWYFWIYRFVMFKYTTSIFYGFICILKMTVIFWYSVVSDLGFADLLEYFYVAITIYYKRNNNTFQNTNVERVTNKWWRDRKVVLPKENSRFRNCTWYYLRNEFSSQFIFTNLHFFLTEIFLKRQPLDYNGRGYFHNV